MHKELSENKKSAWKLKIKLLKLPPKSIEGLENKVKEALQKEKQKEKEMGENDEIQKTNIDPAFVLGNSRKKTENIEGKVVKEIIPENLQELTTWPCTG